MYAEFAQAIVKTCTYEHISYLPNNQFIRSK